MSLNLPLTARQVHAMAQRMRGQQGDRAARLRSALRSLERADMAALNRRVAESQGRAPFLPADAVEPPGTRVGFPCPPADYVALSVDGSRIDVDRHLPARCALINLGSALLRYGAMPDARLASAPRLLTPEDGLVIANPDEPAQETAIQGNLLGIRDAVDEVAGLAELARQAPALPAVAYVDGSLIQWELGGPPEGGRLPAYVRRHMLHDPASGLLPAFDRLRAISAELGNTLALAAHISLPGGSDVVNALRLALCAFPLEDSRSFCRHPAKSLADPSVEQCPCNDLRDFNDRELFAGLLEPGERSAVFRTCSSVVRDEYGPHWVHFFYLNVGDEIARVEVPAWVAEDAGLLGLVHAATVDQCRRGQGYPPVIQEAHEQAVISTEDRRAFKTLVENALEDERLAVYTSQKQRSKQVRGV
jgi:hypothetical protein